MITLHSIFLKNFRSVGDDGLTLIFDEKKHVLFVGDNGAGKSTGPLHALTYNWFNKAYGEKDKLSSLVNSVTKKNCLTVTEFTTNGKRYKVSRGMKPSVFDIEYKDGNKWIRIKDEAERGKYQDILDDIIGVDMGILHNNVLMGLDNFKSFVNLSVPERRVMVEQFLDLTIFSEMNEIAKEKIKDIKKKSELNQRQREFNVSEIENQKRIISTMENAEEDKLNELNQDKKELQKNLVGINEDSEPLKDDVETLQTKIDDLGNPENEIRKLERISSAVKRIDDVKEGIDQAENSIAQTKSDITGFSHDVQHVEEKIAELSYSADEYDKVKSIIVQFQSKIDELEKDNKHLNSIDLCPTCRQTMQEDHRKELIATNNSKIDQLNVGLSRLNYKRTFIEEQSAKHVKLENERLNLTNELKLLKRTLNNDTTSVNNLHKKLETLTETVGDWSTIAIQEEIDKHVKISDQKSKLTEELNDKKLKLNALLTGKKSILKQIETIDTKIKSIEDKPNENIEAERENLKDLENLSVELSEAAEKLEKKHNVAEVSINSLKDSGIKADIISKYIPKFNEYVNYYLNKIEMYLGFEMDEKFSVRFTSPDRKGQTSASLSNGQKRRLDIAIILSWMKIAGLKNTVETNFMIIDEILDAISSDGVAEIIEMLKTEYSEKDIAVTTQRGGEFQEFFENGIYFELGGDGFTKITHVE